jgi:hypothetical protein
LKYPLASLVVFLAACSRGSSPTDGKAPDVLGLEEFLPDQAGPDKAGMFSAEPAVHDARSVRRAYVRGTTRVDVTIGGRERGGAELFDRWVDHHASYPTMNFHVSTYVMKGYFDCHDVDAAAATCDGHILLRSGLYIDLLGGGTATRGALQDLMAGLPIWALAESRGS